MLPQATKVFEDSEVGLDEAAAKTKHKCGFKKHPSCRLATILNCRQLTKHTLMDPKALLSGQVRITTMTARRTMIEGNPVLHDTRCFPKYLRWSLPHLRKDGQHTHRTHRPAHALMTVV